MSILHLVGNVIGILVFLAPIPTFYTIYKKKLSDGFQSTQYIVTLSSTMLLLYHGLFKTDATMIISINAIGCVIKVTYLLLFVFYASKKEKVATLKLVLLLDVGCVLILSKTMFLLKEQQCVNIVGWICAAFSIALFVSPLSIMAKVIVTKRVEFLPICLSLFLILCTTIWFLYSLLIGDMFIAQSTHNLGFLLGIAQMILYMIYKDAKTKNDEAKEKQIDNANLNPCRIKPEATGSIIHVEKTEWPKVSLMQKVARRGVNENR